MTYPEYLSNNILRKNRITYGISETYSRGCDKLEDIKIIPNSRTIAFFDIGWMCNLSIQLEIVSLGSVSILYSVKYLNETKRIRVYCPGNISPEDFKYRLQHKLRSCIMSSTGDIGFADLAEYHDTKYKVFSDSLRTAIENSDINKNKLI